MAFATAFQANAFQNNAFQIAAAVVEQQPGGGYRRPLKYVRNGKILDHYDDDPEPLIVEIEAPLPELSEATLRALLEGPIPEDQSQTLALMLADAERRLAMAQLQREVARIEAMRADDEMAILLLLAA